MKNTKAILAGTFMAPVLALTGGIAYASTTTPGHPAPARATITATARHPAGQDRFGWCDWRYSGYWGDWRYSGYWGDWRGRGHQAQPAHQHHASRHHSYRDNHGYQHRGGYRTQGSQRAYQGYQGNWGYGYQGSGHQGGWSTGNGSRWGNGSGCCRHGW